MTFEVIKTNIVNVTADAIALPANERLKEGSGSSRAIFEAAGRKELTKACSKIGHCAVGSAIPTLAFNLNAKYIVHSVVPRWIDGNKGEYDLLSSAYFSALTVADIMGCKSIAFPLLASGNNGFDKTLAVRIAKESISQFQGQNLIKVMLVVYGDEMELLMRSQGFNVIAIPLDVLVKERDAARRAKAQKFLADSKEIAQKFLEDQTEKAIEWLKDEKNRKKLLEVGILVAKMVIENKKPPK